MKQSLKYLAVGLLPILWAVPGLYVYALCMTLSAEWEVYLLPGLAAALLLLWHRVGRRAMRYDVLRSPEAATGLAHLPLLVLTAVTQLLSRGADIPVDAMLWGMLEAAVRIPFVALFLQGSTLDSMGSELLQYACMLLPMAAAFWMGQKEMPFRTWTLLLPLAAGLLWGFGLEWAYLPILLLWLGWLGYDLYQHQKNR